MFVLISFYALDIHSNERFSLLEFLTPRFLLKMTKLLMDILLISRFITFVRILFPSWKTINFGILIVVLFIHLIGLNAYFPFFNTLFLDQAAAYLIGLLPARFHVSLGKKDEGEFESLILMSILFVAFKAIVSAFLNVKSGFT